jgi:hypothetical protein
VIPFCDPTTAPEEAAMTYLLQHLRRRGGARVDEYLRLNRPGLYGDAFIRAFVEDTVATRREPRVRLRIADCSNTITLEFSLETARHRENALFKTDTLITTLQRFREALAAEAALAAERDT